MLKLDVKRNPDQAEFDRISSAIKLNYGYCISVPDKKPETLCPCRAFRQQVTPGPCACGLFLKYMRDDSVKCIWDNFEEIGSTPKSDTSKIVVGIAVRAGVKYVTIREFYKCRDDDTWRPNRHGISIPILIPTRRGSQILSPLEDLKPLIQQAVARSETIPLSDENNAVYIKLKEKHRNEDS